MTSSFVTLIVSFLLKYFSRLLTIQKEAYNIPSISDLLQLHNNYILETNVNEHVSAQEKMEENTLLDTILSTSVMQHTKNFLIQKGKSCL